MKKCLVTSLATGCLVIGSIGIASAADFDFSGTFVKDNDVLQFVFNVAQDSSVTFFSSSWDEGGFDPILAVWSSSGNKLYQQDDGHNSGQTMSNGVAYSHGTWDSYFNVNLIAGQYSVTIAQYNNFAKTTNLADGFIHDDNPNFTYDLHYGGYTQPYFNGVWDSNDPRTGDWAFHILNVNQAIVIDPNNPAVPEPATMLLFGTGLAGLAAVGRRKK